MRKALICGISGQDGAYLAQPLLGKGYEVYGAFRDAQVVNFKNIVRPERFVTQKIVRAACRIAAGSGEQLNLGNIDVHSEIGDGHPNM